MKPEKEEVKKVFFLINLLAYLSFLDSEAQLIHCQEIVSPTGEHLSITKWMRAYYLKYDCFFTKLHMYFFNFCFFRYMYI